MASFTVTIPDLNKTLAGFDRVRKDAEGAFYAGMLRTAIEAQDEARELAPKDTTTLASSITLEERRRDFEIDVFTNVEYAAINEFGWDGPQNVRQHERTISQAFGRRISPVTVTVTAHTRQVFRPARPYMGPAADSANRRIVANIEAELAEVRL